MDSDESDFLSFMLSAKDLVTSNRPLRLRLAHSEHVSEDMLLPQHVFGVQAICGALEYRILCVSARARLPLTALIALPAAIDFVTDRGELHSVCGIIAEASSGDSDGGLASYQLVLRDALSIMDKRNNTRVFRNKNEVEIVQLILDEWRLKNAVLAAAFDYEFDELFELLKYPCREFTMQYNESDAAFMRRLLKRRGIAWYVRAGGTHDAPMHTLVLFNNAQSLRQSSAGTIRYHRDNATEQRDTITSWNAVRSVQPGSVTRHSWDYRNPLAAHAMLAELHSDLDQGQNGNELAASLHDYRIQTPHVGADNEDLFLLGQLRMQRHDFEAHCVQGAGCVRDLNAGEIFTLEGHPDVDTQPERDFVVTALQVAAQNNLPKALAARAQRIFASNLWMQPQRSGTPLMDVLAEQVGSGPTRMRMRFTAVRRGIEIVPAYDEGTDLPHPPMQSAIVVGPPGEEVHCDRLGRVKIRFPGMRPQDHEHAQGSGAAGAENDSAWIRVASNWAGNGPGSLQQCGANGLPRIGTEALVAFLGGDPDKPIIIGQLYNEQAHPPALSNAGDLPGNRHLSGIKSREVRGGRANQLRLDDSPGEISAQLASDHGQSELNLGYLTQPKVNGHGAPRGEGAELRSDEAVAIRGAKGVLISAERDTTEQLSREDLAGVAEIANGIALQLADLAEKLADDPKDGPQLRELADKLAAWHQASNVGGSAMAGGGAGGEALVAISAPAGGFIGSKESLALGAQSTINTLSAGDTHISAGGNLFLRTTRCLSMFAYQLGIKLIAASGNIRIQARGGDIEITSLKRIKLIANEGMELHAPSIKVVAQGAQVDYGGGKITQQSSGAHAIKSSTFDHLGAGDGSPEELDLPAMEVEHDQQVIVADSRTDEPLANRRYRITLEDGAVFDGTTDAEGFSQKFTTKTAFARYRIDLLDEGA